MRLKLCAAGEEGSGGHEYAYVGVLAVERGGTRFDLRVTRTKTCGWWSVYSLSSMLAPEDRISKIGSSRVRGICDSGGPWSDSVRHSCFLVLVSRG